MPVATPRTTMNSTKASKASSLPSSSTKLRSITEDQADTWSKALRNRSSEYHKERYPDDEDEYPFKDQDLVWVRTKEEKWCAGKVSGGQHLIRAGRTRYRKEGLFYPVKFGGKRGKHNIRKYFAPTNGEIKPDTKAVRRVLMQEGWIDEDYESEVATASDSSDGPYVD